MGKICVFVNQKGGVGKTTSAINIGAYIALAGKKVLLVDFDSQGNMSSGVGIEKDKPTVYELVMNRATAEQTIKRTVVPGLSAIPASIDLSGAAVELVGEDHREFFLKRALSIPTKYAVFPFHAGRSKSATAPVWAIASTSSTPGITGLPGKCPAKYGSLKLTHFFPTARIPGSSSSIVSIRRKGCLWGRISMISFAVYTDIFYTSYFFIKRLALCPPKPSELESA